MILHNKYISVVTFRIILFLFFSLQYLVVKGQSFLPEERDINLSEDKLLIDSNGYRNWPTIEGTIISDNGKYVYYSIEYSMRNEINSVIKECNGDWEFKVPLNTFFRFSGDSKFAVWTSKDTLFIIKLGESHVEAIPGVKNVLLPSRKGGGFVFYKSNFTNNFVMRDMRSGLEKYFQSVDLSSISNDGENLLLGFSRDDSLRASLSSINLLNGKISQLWSTESNVRHQLGDHYSSSQRSRAKEFIRDMTLCQDKRSVILELECRTGDSTFQSLIKIELLGKRATEIWRGRNLTKFIMNPSATRFALMISEDKDSKSIWYKEDKKGLVLMVNNRLLSMDSLLVVDDLTRFSGDERFVLFSIRKLKKRIDTTSISSTVTVWSYLDTKLQSTQLKEASNDPIYSSAIDLRNRMIIRLQQDYDWMMSNSKDNNVYLIRHTPGDADGVEWFWNRESSFSYIIRTLRDKKDVSLNVEGLVIIGVSPGGRFVVYFDKLRESYFSYEISSGVYRNITSEIGVSWINSFRDDLSKVPRGIAGWFTNDNAVLIYDRFDIWLVDPIGKRKPINITNGYGKKQSLVFSLGLSEYSQSVFLKNDTLILNAINLNNKQNGYFRKILDRPGDPEKLTMGNYIYQLVDNHYVERSGFYPIKAKDEKMYIVQRMSATEFPNLFFTDDFKRFRPITNLSPERAYNWYTTELHQWKKKNGTFLQGVLYKPENFDASKKYPIIFCYYERKSYSLNEYLSPSAISNGCELNIPTFVSNGYLIFAPDISYEIGDPMQGTYDAVVSAAHYITQLPYVDGKRMGIGGCSFGGLQTNYLITHSSLFAAAYSSSSLSDLISAYGDIPDMYQGLNNYFEQGQARMGGSLWERKDMYIKNSPIFSADKVTSPLLLMHTTNDAIYSFSQAIEFYTALRRLGKRVWLLEYSNANHGIYGDAAKDFGIRMSQFFDHYLKGKRAPIWMTLGILAEDRNRNGQYLLDYKVITPGKGLSLDSLQRE